MGSTPGAVAGDALLARRATRPAVLLALGIASLLSVSCFANEATAQSLALHLSAPRECPSRTVVHERVLALLENAEPKIYTLRVVAKIVNPERADYRLSLQIDTGTHRAQRDLHATQCADLVETAAWLIALAVDPELSLAAREANAKTEAAEQEQAATRDRATASSAARTEPSSREPKAEHATHQESGPRPSETRTSTNVHKGSPSQATAARRELARGAEPPDDATTIATPSATWTRAFRAGGSAGIVTGDGAGVQATLGAFAGYGVGVWYTQIRAQGSLPRQIDVATTGHVRLWALSAELSECALFGGALRVGPCVGMSLLRSTAQLKGLATAHDRAYLWAAGGAGLQLFWRLRERIELSLAAAARLPISRRPRYVVAGLGTVVSAQTWAADVRLGVGFVLR